MHSMISGVLAAVVALGLAAGPADAAKKKALVRAASRAALYPAPDRTVIRIDGVTRIVVNRRSYLDPGTAVRSERRQLQGLCLPDRRRPGPSQLVLRPGPARGRSLAVAGTVRSLTRLRARAV